MCAHGKRPKPQFSGTGDRERAVNKPTRPQDLVLPKITTGPIAGSRKIYDSPPGYPDLKVPFREIQLHESANEPPVRVYDPSGPYTETDIKIDVEAGLPRIREAWIKERGNVESYTGRDVKPEDNGNATGKHLARDFPNKPQPMRALSTDKPITQLEYARAGIITKEMVYIAHRENLGRTEALARANLPRGRSESDIQFLLDVIVGTVFQRTLVLREPKTSNLLNQLTALISGGDGTA